MPVVCLRGPLRQLAGGVETHELHTGTVLELLRELEDAYPPLRGWIIDERGVIRRHLHVFINGERGLAQTTVAVNDRVEILTAITGG